MRCLRRREERLAAMRRRVSAARAADGAGSAAGWTGTRRAVRRPGVCEAQSNSDPESSPSSEGFQQCYNAQAAVDAEHQLVVATDDGERERPG